MLDHTFQTGVRIREEVLGSEHYNRTVEARNAFDDEFHEFVSEYCWGAAWGRGILSRQKRSILNLGMLAALGRNREFEIHFRAALLRNKVPLEELREVLMQVAVYCGVPAAVEAFSIAKKVLAEENIDLSGLHRVTPVKPA
ncbi:carboxymuconolactone decarboxylase family protein [Ramlibacter sp.]|uniref:carboxymuconolactone decarboxylase family protein n=1 Tax=Ramlibacter sp. TaxID=1917967 RepID=UPI002FC92BB5